MFRKKVLFTILGMSLATFSACNNTLTSEQIHNNKYNTLETAFNNIEKTLIKDSYIDKSLHASKKYFYHGYDFEDLFSLFKDEDIIDHKPYISKSDYSIFQFLLIKSFYEKVGNSFNFGKCYSQSIFSDVYYDFENGIIDTDMKDENKYSCSFDITLKINFRHYEPGEVFGGVYLGGNIQNFVSVIANFDNGKDSFSKEFMSVNDISYSFDSDNINYDFVSTTHIDDSENPYSEHSYSYTYDFANIENGVLNEWGRFNISSDNQLNFESTYDSEKEKGTRLYPSEGLRFINNGLFKLNDLSDEDSETFSKTMYGFHSSQNYLYKVFQETKSGSYETNLISQSYFELIENLK